MKQKKIEHITLNLIVFGTIAIIGVLARQTVLHYGWDEFSSYLILVVCSIIMGAIYLNLQMVFYNPQIQISAESETKRSIFREKDKTKRSKKESAQHSKSRNKSFVMTSVSAL